MRKSRLHLRPTLEKPAPSQPGFALPLRPRIGLRNRRLTLPLHSAGPPANAERAAMCPNHQSIPWEGLAVSCPRTQYRGPANPALRKPNNSQRPTPAAPFASPVQSQGRLPSAVKLRPRRTTQSGPGDMPQAAATGSPCHQRPAIAPSTDHNAETGDENRFHPSPSKAPRRQLPDSIHPLGIRCAPSMPPTPSQTPLLQMSAPCPTLGISAPRPHRPFCPVIGHGDRPVQGSPSTPLSRSLKAPTSLLVPQPARCAPPPQSTPASLRPNGRPRGSQAARCLQ